LHNISYIQLRALYRMSSIESSSSEGRYRRRRRRNEQQTLSTNNCVVESSSILQCTAAVVFSTSIQHTEEPSNRINKSLHHDRRPCSVSSGRWFMTAMMIISLIAVNNYCCFAFQSPAIIQRSTGRIQHNVMVS